MIGQNIKKLRLTHKLTLRDLADKIGVSYSEISRWECGLFEPRKKYRKKMAELFNIEEIELWK